MIVAQASVRIRVNGRERMVPEGTTVADLVREAGKEPEAVAVEWRGEILPRPRYGEARLAAGDRVELVHFVQGG